MNCQKKYFQVLPYLKLIVLSFFMFLFSKGVKSQNLKFENISIEDGLSNGSVYDIFKDKKGFIWFCTDNGINRYDGYQFKIFGTIKGDSSSLSYHKTRRIVEDNYGHLWVATHEGLNAFDYQKEVFTQFLNDPQDHNSISDSHIIDLVYDHKGNLWILTLNQLNFLSNKELRKNKIEEVEFEKIKGTASGQSKVGVQAIFEDQKNDVWIATEDGYLKKLNRETNEFNAEVIKIESEKTKFNVLKISEDFDGDFWLLTQSSGIIKWNRKENSWDHFTENSNNSLKLNSNFISDIFFNMDGKVWIATNGNGLNIYDPNTQKTVYHYNEISDYQSLPSNSVSRIFSDESGIIWIGTLVGGISKFVIKKSYFGHYTSGVGPNSLNGKNITSFCEDKKGQVWIGTDGNGINIFNRYTNSFKSIHANSGTGLSSNTILSICADKDGNIWMGTWQNGLIKYNPTTEKYTNYTHNANDTTSIANNNIFKVFEDSKGNVWSGTLQTGLDLFDKKRNLFIHYKHNDSSNSLNDDIIFSIFEDSKQRLWIGHNLGVDMIDLNATDFNVPNPQLNFNHFRHPDNHRAVVYCIQEDHKGNIWIGNERSGIYILSPDMQFIKHLDESNGLPSNDITGILEDENYNMWISSSKGLCKYNPANEAIQNYIVDDGIQSMIFNRACIKTSDGQLFFGGINGFNAFYPQKINQNDKIPTTVITNFKIFNNPVVIGEKINNRIIFNKSIHETQEIKLSYRENFFSLDFASLDYTSPRKNQYSYFMEGVDADWNLVGNKNEANYTNLKPGEYLFTVKSSNNDGVWNTIGTTLKITITPPFWKTKWMYTIYLIFVMGIIYLAYFIIINNEKLKNQVEIERLELRKTKEVNDLKMNIFTNISHEFRTPLTLLSGPLEALINEGKGDEQTKYYHSLMYRNARQLQRLINQLLDFRMIEEGKMKVERECDDMVSFIRSSVASFDFLAKQREMQYTFSCNKEVFYSWCDLEKLEKILLNLLSNAFKYTADRGSIDVKAEFRKTDIGNLLHLQISDNGLGIPNESLETIFSVFHRVKDKKSYISESTGLGLSLTKSLVEVLDGKITVESEEGRGSVFTVMIPLEEIPDGAVVGTTINKKKSVITAFNKSESIIDTNEKKESSSSKSVLIIEDNHDVLDFIEMELKPFYEVVKAYNGVEGFKLATEIMPDIIISDIMMPEMDGRELCRKLKEEISTSHIPVILLTANQSDEYRIDGYGAGADEYIAKPFNSVILRARITNLLENRARLRELFNKNNNFDTSLSANNQTDSDFLHKVMEIINNNLNKADFDVDNFAMEMNLGRSIFFKKIKALTNQTPHQLITACRMKKATELLINTNKTVSEIAFEVGFSELSNFSRSFTKFNGMSPTKYSEVYKK